jgi:hypothetical protein
LTRKKNIELRLRSSNQLQDDWKNTGSIPHDAYVISYLEDTVMRRISDFISLSKELRDKK